MSEKLKFESAGDKVSESFCIMPWTHLHTWPNGNVFPCCLADSNHPIGNLKRHTLEQIWNSPDLKKIRTQFLKGEQPAVCKRCYMQEEMGTPSFRISSNNQWSHHIDKAVETTQEDGTDNNFKLNYWDFRFSNVCNLRCRMCGPELSSSWYADQIKFYGSSTTSQALIHMNDGSLEDIMVYVDRFINEVEEIYFAGGEPLIMEEHYRILEMLIAAGNTKCRIRYNTNFSRIKYRGVNLFDDILVHLRDWQICASIDGTGAIGEYIRTGLHYTGWLHNFRQGLAHARHPRQMRLDFTLTLPGMFEVENMQKLGQELGVDILAKVIFSFSPDIMMSPLALPRELLEPWIDELVPNTTGAMQDVLVQLKQRPTFEEQWPDQYQAGLQRGKARIKKLESIRPHGVIMDDIVSRRPAVSRWWHAI